MARTASWVQQSRFYCSKTRFVSSCYLWATFLAFPQRSECFAATTSSEHRLIFARRAAFHLFPLRMSTTVEPTVAESMDSSQTNGETTMDAASKLAALRQLMKARDLDVYLVPTDDPHLSGAYILYVVALLWTDQMRYQMVLLTTTVVLHPPI
jgi:hypothetical protein